MVGELPGEAEFRAFLNEGTTVQEFKEYVRMMEQKSESDSSAHSQ